VSRNNGFFDFAQIVTSALRRPRDTLSTVDFFLPALQRSAELHLREPEPVAQTISGLRQFFHLFAAFRFQQVELFASMGEGGEPHSQQPHLAVAVPVAFNLPRDKRPYVDLPFISVSLGNHEKALKQTREALRLEPDNEDSYSNLGNSYANLNRLDEAEAVYKQAEQRKLEDEILLTNSYLLAFLKGETAQMAQVAATAIGKPGPEDVLLALQADTEAWYGRLKNARELTRGAMESAEHSEAKETAATYQAAAALREVESGNPERARIEADAAVKLAPDRDVRSMAALALARAGDMAGAERLAAELNKTFPLDTMVQRYWLPSIRAADALQHKDANRALELLKAASSIELGEPTGFSIYLCPVYLRGEAYLMLHDGNRAAAEFQKFIDHRGLVGNFQWGALARLGLARAYALQRDTVKAHAAYQDFLMLWKDADPDIPVLHQAKAEYAKLH
jgi:eukaryotic-like serine/threonine-protein kinase